MRVSERGQVTIPAPIRDKLGLRGRAEVDVRLVGKTIEITVKPKPRRGKKADELRQRLRDSVTFEEDIVSPTGERWDATR